jgi:hypothetical protein
VLRARLVGEPAAVQRREQPVAGAVSGEDSARAVAAMGRRSKPDDQQSGARVAEARERPPPVVLLGERRSLRCSHRLAPVHEAGTRATRNDLLGERLKGGRGRHDNPVCRAFSCPTARIRPACLHWMGAPTRAFRTPGRRPRAYPLPGRRGGPYRSRGDRDHGRPRRRRRGALPGTRGGGRGFPTRPCGSRRRSNPWTRARRTSPPTRASSPGMHPRWRGPESRIRWPPTPQARRGRSPSRPESSRGDGATCSSPERAPLPPEPGAARPTWVPEAPGS